MKNYHVPAFNECFSVKRYKVMSRFFLTYDNNTIPMTNTDRLIRVRRVMGNLTSMCIGMYFPKKQISLDEGSMAWMGCLVFKVYQPNKPDKYGVKMHILADSKTMKQASYGNSEV